jgi:hypothetical protein
MAKKNKEKVERKEKVDVTVTTPVISKEIGEQLMLKLGIHHKIQPKQPKR